MLFLRTTSVKLHMLSPYIGIKVYKNVLCADSNFKNIQSCGCGEIERESEQRVTCEGTSYFLVAVPKNGIAHHEN